MMINRLIKAIWLFALMAIMLVVQPTALAKHYCDKYAQKIDQLQAKQRMGYSAKQSQRLTQQLIKARERWRECENTPLATFKKKHKYKHKHKR